MTEYTPTTDDLFSWLSSITTEEDVRSVRRWLAEHDRQVAERAWSEGRITMARDTGKTNSGAYTATPNPYRKEATGDWPPPKSRDEIRKGAIDEIAEVLKEKEATGV